MAPVVTGAPRCDYLPDYFSHTSKRIVIFINQAVRKCEENCKPHYRCNLGKNIYESIHGSLAMTKEKDPHSLKA